MSRFNSGVVWCPDCKTVRMELVVPDDSENYYHCPKCEIEISQDEGREEE